MLYRSELIDPNDSMPVNTHSAWSVNDLLSRHLLWLFQRWIHNGAHRGGFQKNTIWRSYCYRLTSQLWPTSKFYISKCLFHLVIQVCSLIRIIGCALSPVDWYSSRNILAGSGRMGKKCHASDELFVHEKDWRLIGYLRTPSLWRVSSSWLQCQSPWTCLGAIILILLFIHDSEIFITENSNFTWNFLTILDEVD